MDINQNHSCLYEVVGLNSFSSSCGIDVPVVFSRVSSYLDWIENVVWLNGNGSNAAVPSSPKEPVFQSPFANRTFVKSEKDRLLIVLVKVIKFHFIFQSVKNIITLYINPAD